MYPVYPPSTQVYPSSTPQQQQQLTSIRRAQPSSSSRQEVSRALPAGANVRFLCRGVSPPSPHQPAAPPKLQPGNHLSASMRQTLFLLPSPQQQHQAAQLKHSSLTLATPPPGPNSSREVQTPDEDPPQQKCQHQLPTSRVTGACCLLRSRGDPPVLRRGQARYFPFITNSHYSISRQCKTASSSSPTPGIEQSTSPSLIKGSVYDPATSGEAGDAKPAPVAIEDRLGLDAPLKHLLGRLRPRFLPNITGPTGSSSTKYGEKPRCTSSTKPRCSTNCFGFPSSAVVKLVHHQLAVGRLGGGEEEQEEKRRCQGNQ